MTIMSIHKQKGEERPARGGLTDGSRAPQPPNWRSLGDRKGERGGCRYPSPVAKVFKKPYPGSEQGGKKVLWQVESVKAEDNASLSRRLRSRETRSSCTDSLLRSRSREVEMRSRRRKTQNSSGSGATSRVGQPIQIGAFEGGRSKSLKSLRLWASGR